MLLLGGIPAVRRLFMNQFIYCARLEITITAFGEHSTEDPDTFSNLENARFKILPGNTTHRSTLETGPGKI
jgi:hypothetical protein